MDPPLSVTGVDGGKGGAGLGWAGEVALGASALNWV